MSWVDAAGRCVGFFIYRGKLGYEAFDGDEKSLGMFPTKHEAAAAVLNTREISKRNHREPALVKSPR
jgi:hypothetical protein